MITIYHRTSPEAADSIVKAQAFRPGWADYSYFSSRKNIGAQGRYYGSAVVAVTIPKSEFNRSIGSVTLKGVRTIVIAPSRLDYLLKEKNSKVRIRRIE